MFKTPMNETDNEVDAALPRLTLLFSSFIVLLLTSDLFSVFLLNLNGVSTRHHSKWYWFMTNNLSLLIHEIDNETWVKAYLFHIFDRYAFCSFFGGCYFVFFKHSLPLERVELISFPFFLAFFCANPSFFLLGECSHFSPPNHDRILKKDNPFAFKTSMNRFISTLSLDDS